MLVEGTSERPAQCHEANQANARGDLLVSILMQSNRPEGFAKFLDNLQETTDDCRSFEVIVKIDDHDEAMNRHILSEITRRPFRIKFISTPLPEGFYGLWRSMNEMLPLCNPQAYFLVNLNDEMRMRTHSWDTALRKYVGFFPDHIFRLRTSHHRHRNYYDFWEAGFANDTSAFMTRRWIEIGGDWCPCNGPDSFQECVAFYLGKNRWFWNNREDRDIAISDIAFDFPGTSLGVQGAALRRRMRGAFWAWARLMSHTTQEEASRRAEKLYAHIWAHRNNIPNYSVSDSRQRREIVLRENSEPWREAAFHYGLSRPQISLTNIYRICRFGTFFYGDGYWIKRSWPEGFIALLCMLSENVDRLVDIARDQPFYDDVRRFPRLRQVYKKVGFFACRFIAAIYHPRLALRSLVRRWRIAREDDRRVL